MSQIMTHRSTLFNSAKYSDEIDTTYWINESRALNEDYDMLLSVYKKLFGRKPKIKNLTVLNNNIGLMALSLAQRNGNLYMKMKMRGKATGKDVDSAIKDELRLIKKTNNRPKRKRSNKTAVVCIETGEIFYSINDLNKKFNCDVYYRIKKGMRINGRMYKYLK